MNSDDTSTGGDGATGASERRTQRTGRRSRVHHQLTSQRLMEALRVGADLHDALSHAGVARSTYFAWTRRGRMARETRESGNDVPTADLPFLDFLDQIERERAVAQIAALTTVLKSARKGNWKAAVWWLERRYPEQWGRRSKGEPFGRHRENENYVSVTDLEEACLRVDEQRRAQDRRRAAM